jgi:hypothetical protein
MIRISWFDIVAAAQAAAKAEGGTISAAQFSAVTLAAKAIESVLASSIESPGSSPPISFSLAQLGALALANATGKILTVRPSSLMAVDYSLTMPTSDGAPGQVLSTDGAGNLRFIPAGGGGGAAGWSRTMLLMGG